MTSQNLSTFFRGSDTTSKERKFAKRLEQFKHTGCSILITGNADSYLFNQQLTQAFGGSDRKQVLVAADAEAPTRVFSDDISPSAASVEIIGGQHVRHAVSSSPSNQLEKLSSDVLNTVHRYDDRWDLSDNDLRVGVEAVDQLSDKADQQTVKRFIRSLSQTVEFVNGTLYCQFRGVPERAGYLIDSGLFDARIELRKNTHAQQRWHLFEDDITTDWVKM